MFWQAVGALTPMVCVALLFWYVMRIVFSADRREREAMAQFELQEREAGRKGAFVERDSPRNRSVDN